MFHDYPQRNLNTQVCVSYAGSRHTDKRQKLYGKMGFLEALQTEAKA